MSDEKLDKSLLEMAKIRGYVGSIKKMPFKTEQRLEQLNFIAEHKDKNMKEMKNSILEALGCEQISRDKQIFTKSEIEFMYRKLVLSKLEAEPETKINNYSELLVYAAYNKRFDVVKYLLIDEKIEIRTGGTHIDFNDNPCH